MDIFDPYYYLVEKEETFVAPEAVRKEAQKAIDWRDEHGDDEVTAMTRTGWVRANQLAKGEKISYDTVKRMAAFERHRKNSKISPENKDEPWKDKGHVAWLGWGGDAGIAWAKKIVAQKEKETNEATNYDDIIDRDGDPSDEGLWKRAVAAARKKFDVYPSAVANAWAVKWYKKNGGTFK